MKSVSGQKGSGKWVVISLLVIIGLSVAGVITALMGEKRMPPEAAPVEIPAGQ